MTHNYEAMFLFDPGAASDWETVRREVDRLMERAGAQVIACAKWDECRLAYEIRGRRRGLYVLTYFKAEPGAIAGLERDARLSELIMRVLILRVDHMTEQQMKEAACQRRHAPHGDGDGHDEGHGQRQGRRAAAAEPAGAQAAASRNQGEAAGDDAAEE